MDDIFLADTSKKRLVSYCFGFSFAIALLIFNLLYGGIFWDLCGIPSRSSAPPWVFDKKRDALNYGLTSNQCNVAFPGLFREIDNAVRRRQWRLVTSHELKSDHRRDKTIRIRIWDQKIYVVGSVWPHVVQPRIYSTLLGLERALKFSPVGSELPNIETVISTDDDNINTVNQSVWSYSRRSYDNNAWLLPDLGYFERPEQRLEYSDVRGRMANVEKNFPTLDDKIQKLVWHGNIAQFIERPLRLKRKLMDAAANKSWADLGSLDLMAPKDKKLDPIPIEDHCKYAYIANTEGSTSLKYMQNCESVILAHRQRWLQHHHHLMRYNGPEQNYVRIRRDFADLSGKMEDLISDPELAKRIARNNAETFRDRYLTPAAEACYWRKLIHGWAAVTPKPDFLTPAGPDEKWTTLESLASSWPMA